MRKRGSSALGRANCRVCCVSNSVYRKSSNASFFAFDSVARVSLDHDSAMTNRRGYISRGSLCEDAAVAVPVYRKG